MIDRLEEDVTVILNKCFHTLCNSLQLFEFGIMATTIVKSATATAILEERHGERSDALLAFVLFRKILIFVRLVTREDPSF